MGEGSSLRFTKHHGSGNDFLVILEPAGKDLIADEVRALCERHRGIGADGLIVGRPGTNGADLEMILSNADGSPAEMSGNGIRCLVQAAVANGMTTAGTVLVDTGAGRRRVEYREVANGLGYAEVDMGAVVVGDDLPLDERPAALAGPGTTSRACAVNVGNPHIVLLALEDGPDLREVGPLIESAVDGGVNVEVVRECDGSAVDIEVWERGGRHDRVVRYRSGCGRGCCDVMGIGGCGGRRGRRRGRGEKWRGSAPGEARSEECHALRARSPDR